MTVLDWYVLQIKTKIISCHTADSNPVKQEVNCTVILPPLVFPGWSVTNVLIKGHVGQMSVTQMCFDQKTRHLFFNIHTNFCREMGWLFLWPV